MIFKKYNSVLFYLTFILILSAGCVSSIDDDNDLPEEFRHEVKLTINYEGNWELNENQKINETLNPYVKDYLNNGTARHKINIYKSNDVSSGSIPVASYELEKIIEEDSYDFGNRFMLFNDTLIDTKTKSITIIPLTEQELKELKEKLEFAVLTNSTIKFER